MKRFFLYLIRWQLSTPILWLVVRNLGASVQATILANLVGGSIFFWVDRFIFTSQALEVWHIKEGRCDKCGKVSKLHRLVKTAGYDRSGSNPIFLCPACSHEKSEELKAKGIQISGKPK